MHSNVGTLMDIRLAPGSTDCTRCDKHFARVKQPINYTCDCVFFQEVVSVDVENTSVVKRPHSVISGDNEEQDEKMSATTYSKYRPARNGLLKLESEFIARFIKSRTISGRACEEGQCQTPASFICTSCRKPHRVCELHESSKPTFHSCFFVDERYLPSNHSIPETKRSKTLLVTVNGWKYIEMKEADELLSNLFFPASSKFPEVAFCFRLIEMAYAFISATGQSCQKVFEGILNGHRVPPPVNVEKEFSRVMQVSSPWLKNLKLSGKLSY